MDALPGTLYPPEMAVELNNRWSSVNTSLPLPAPEHLGRLLDTAYQASLLREEGEPVRCRLIFAQPSDFSQRTDVTPDQLVVLRFDRPCDVSTHDIRKLAAAAGFYRAMLGVELTTDNRLQIWGMILTGTRWVNRVEGGRFLGVPLPSQLVIQILGPGHLVVASGYQRVLETSGGHLLSEGFDPFHSSWLSRRFTSVRNNLLLEMNSMAGSESTTQISEMFIKNVAQSVIRRTLSLIRSRGHGGMLIYIPDSTLETLRIRSWFRFRATFQTDESTRRFRHLIRALLRRLIAIGQAQGLAVVTWDDYQRIQDAELTELDESLIELAHVFADLMSVDGALVMDQGFRLIGFGGEILGDSHVRTIHRALDVEAERTVEEPADSSGTRHRSAYRLVSGLTEAVVVVVSQDGAVRFVAYHHDKLTYWPYLP